jgi:hypothetical protein
MHTVEISTEAGLVRKIAEEYEAKGYEVIVHPLRNQLPRPLAEYQPDLIGRKGGEIVVIEVKSRQSLRQEPSVERLARAVQGMPGARFELVIAKPDVSSPLPENTRPWSEHEAACALDEAARLLHEGRLVPALLLGWAAAEAALRILASREEVKTEKNDASYLLNRLVGEGVLGERQYHSLRRALEFRNAAAHGLEPTGLRRAQVQILLRTVAGLLTPTATVTEAT